MEELHKTLLAFLKYMGKCDRITAQFQYWERQTRMHIFSKVSFKEVKNIRLGNTRLSTPGESEGDVFREADGSSCGM